MKSEIFAPVLILMLISVILVSGCLQQEKAIGGERDEHGCLGAAGYTYNATVNACIREWELNTNQKQAAKIAVEHAGFESGLAIVRVDVARCPGCFVVHMTTKDYEQIQVNLENWQVIGSSPAEDTSCAKDGERYSQVYEEHPEHCCEGLKEWLFGMDTRVSIADECYETGIPSGLPVGICITCGDGVCGNYPNYLENPCNCPEDCAGKNKSDFLGIEEFCQSNDWNYSFSEACEETIKDFPICKLC